MRILLRFFRRPLRDQFALVRAAALVGSVRAALALLPFERVLRAADFVASRPGRRPVAAGERDRMMRAVETAAHYMLPAGPCLSQAIVADALLRRGGWPSQLHIGVARSPRGEMQAHAWVESDGVVVVGGAESPAEYRAFPDPRGPR